jgi:hypothetical protein
MDRGSPEEFFSQYGAMETFGPIDGASHELPPIDAYEAEEINVEPAHRRGGAW